MKCKELMVGDLINNLYGVQMRVAKVHDGYAHAAPVNSRRTIWRFDDECEHPVPISLTPEILEINGWKDNGLWYEYIDDNVTIQSCLPDMRGIINGVEIKEFQCKYVHQYQHLLRLCGLNELADNFKV